MRRQPAFECPFSCRLLEGVYLDRTEAGLKPRFVKVEPPTDADIADVCSCGAGDVVQKISRRVIRTLRRLGYLEAGIDAVVATGYDSRLDNEPALARTMAASVPQRLAFGERAGQQVRRIGAGFGYEGTSPALTGPRCARVNGFSLHANTQVPAHRRDQLERLMRYTGRGALSLERLAEDANGDLVYMFIRSWSDGTTGITLSPLELLEKLAATPLPHAHLVRYAGCLAPHSKLRDALIPTSRQQGMDGDETQTGTPYWNWARLRGRVCNVDMATCPLCRRGSLRLIAAMTQEAVVTRIRRHLNLAAIPPPIAPARCRQAQGAWVDEAHDMARGLVGDVRAAEGCLTPLSLCNPVGNPPLSPQLPFPRPSAQGNPCEATLPPSETLVQAALGRATPGSALETQPASPARGGRRRGRWGARGRGGGAKRAFILPIHWHQRGLVPHTPCIIQQKEVSRDSKPTEGGWPNCSRYRLSSKFRSAVRRPGILDQPVAQAYHSPSTASGCALAEKRRGTDHAH
jgi:Putative transposase